MLSEVQVVSKSKVIGVVSVFSALIAVSTIFAIPLPQPLGEFTWSPPIYMALSVLAGPWPAFFATALGSFVGESTNVAVRGLPPIYALGIVWARAPEALFIGWARKKDRTTLAVVMGLATAYETIAFLLPDWAFYTYGLFGYGSPQDIGKGFLAALPDILTIFDVVYVPVAFAIIRAASLAFKRFGLR